MIGKFIISLTILLMSSTFVSAETDTDSFKVYTEEHPLRILCDRNLPPYEFVNDEGKPTGYNVEVVDHILSIMNVPHKFIMHDFNKLQEIFNRNDFDLSIDAKRPEGNNNLYYGYVPMEYYNLCIIRRKDTKPIARINDIANKGIYVQSGDISEDLILHRINSSCNIIGVNNIRTAIGDVSLGKIDYIVWLKESSKWIINKYGFSNLIISDIDIPMQDILFISPHKWITERMDEKFAQMQQNGDLEYLHAKWFQHQNMKKDNSYLVLFIIAFLTVVTMILIVLNHVLKSRINRAKKRSDNIYKMKSLALKMDKSNIAVFKPNNRHEYGDSWNIEKIHPDDRYFVDEMGKIFRGEIETLDRIIQYNKGSENKPIWKYFNITAIAEKEKKKINNIVITWKDITEDRMEQDRYKEMYDKYLAVFDSALLGLSFYDKDGFLINSNEQMRKIFKGVDLEDEKGKYNIKESLIGEYICNGNDIVSFHASEHIKSRGLDFYAEMQVEPVKDDNDRLRYIIVSIIDVSYERELRLNLQRNVMNFKNTRTGLLHYSDMLKNTLNMSKTRIWMADFNKRTMSCSKDMKAYNLSVSFEDYINSLSIEDKDIVKEILSNGNKEKPQFLNYVQHIANSVINGEEKWISIVAKSINDKEGNVIGYEGLLHDVTELMFTQQRLKTEAKNAEDSDHIKSMFLANMSHEIRTPLNSIVGFAELLEGLNRQERDEFLRIIDKNCDLLLRLINDIIELSDMDTNLQTIVPEDVDWAQNFNDICTSLKRRVTNPNIEYIIENPYHIFNTILDTKRLNQVITNFVTNAVKYTQQGHIKVGYEYREQGLYIYCEDTGSGIPEDKKEKVFERFVKLNDFIQGTGLGLSICKTIADRYRGRIGVDSKEGEGSTFWIWIPCKYVEEK